MAYRNDTEATRRVRTILRTLLSNFRFFGTLALQMQLVIDRERKTVACNGQELFYNPDWVRKSNSDELAYAISRVVLACALKHHTRREKRDYETWQKASAYTTAPYIGQYMQHPKGVIGMHPNPIGADELSVEEAYKLFRKSQGKGKGKSDEKQSSDPFGSGEVMDAPTPENKKGKDNNGKPESGRGKGSGDKSQSQAKALADEERKWDKRTHQALSIAKETKKSKPSSGGSLQDIFAKAHSPKQEWHEILRRYMNDLAREDYTMARPNRRFIDSGLYLPSLTGTRMKDLVVAIDVSGSIDKESLDLFWSELVGIAEEIQPEKVTVIHCSHKVTAVDEFDGYDLPQEMQGKGYGGTKFAPVFAKVDELFLRPACLLYFTDQECYKIDYPDQDPDYPVLWASTAKIQPARKWMAGTVNYYPIDDPPFGDVIFLDK